MCGCASKKSTRKFAAPNTSQEGVLNNRQHWSNLRRRNSGRRTYLVKGQGMRIAVRGSSPESQKHQSESRNHSPQPKNDFVARVYDNRTLARTGGLNLRAFNREMRAYERFNKLQQKDNSKKSGKSPQPCAGVVTSVGMSTTRE